MAAHELLTEATRARWDEFVLAHPFGTWWHTSHWLDYQVAYTGGENASAFLMHGDEIVAVSPLIVVGGRAEMGGMPLPLALWADGTATPPDRLIGGLTGGRFMGQPGDEGDERSRMWRTRLLTLDVGLERTWRDVRKSYHSLIHRAERTFRIEVGTSMGLGQDYERVHRQAGGTRPSRTYALQRAWLKEGFGFAACAYTREHEPAPVAATYVLVYKGWAYYASGPALLPSVQHALQWAAIKELIARGDVGVYELGWQGEATSEKGKGIEFFKSGWGGTDVPFPVWEVAGDGDGADHGGGGCPQGEDAA